MVAVDTVVLKDSDIKWVEKIAKDFDVKPLFTVFDENKSKNDLEEDYDVLSLSYGKLKIKDKGDNKGLLSETNDSYQIIEPGYIVLRLTDLQNDHTSLRVGIAKNKGIITSAYVGLKHKASMNTEYFYYLLHAYDLMKVFYGYGGGIRQGMSYGDLKKLPIIIPPEKYQKAVVTFLNMKSSKVDLFIQNKQKYIDNLIERKQAIVNEAVTMGRGGNTATKPCSIRWLNEMPVDWSISPIKHVARINKATLSEKTDGEIEILYVDIGNVDSDGNILHKEPYMFADAPSRARRIVKDGDTVVSTVRTYLRAIGYIDKPEENLVVSTGFAVCSPDTQKIDKKFLQYAVRANYFIENVVSNSYGVSYPAITSERLGAHKIIYPASISEQEAIVRMIEKETSIIDKAISKARQQINLIKEYRDSLIIYSVTGQIRIGD